MKTVISVILIMLVAVVSKGQQERFLPVKGDVAISLNLTGLDNIFLNSEVDPVSNDVIVNARYFFKDNMAFRIGFGMNTNNDKNTTVSDSSGGQNFETSEKVRTNHSLSFRIGAEKHISRNSSTVEFLFGPAIHFDLLGGKKVVDTDHIREPNGNIHDTKTEMKNPGGFNLALRMNAGFFWYVSKNIALGGELGFGYSFGNKNGDVKTSVTRTDVVGGVSSSSSSAASSPKEDSAAGLETTNLGNIILLVKF